MQTKKNQAAFKLLFIVVGAVLLAGCKPPGPKALLQGKRLLEKGQPAAAVVRLEVATQLLSTNAQAWNYLGIAYHQNGQPSNAVVAYKRALGVNPDLMETRLNLGSLWLELGRWADAKSEFTAYTLRRPKEAAGFQQLAQAELQLRELATSEQHVRKALQLDDTDPAAWNTLGLIQLQRGKSRDAAQSFGGALQRQGDFAPAMINLAVLCQQQLGDRATALKLYRQYLRLKPEPADAAAVAAVARQLEIELTPARPAPVAPKPPAPVVPVSPVPDKPVVETPPPTPPAPVATVAVTPVPKPVPPEPKPIVPLVQTTRRPPAVVKVPAEPEIKVAPVVETSPPVTLIPREPVAPISQSSVSEATAAPAPEEEKSGFFQKINPLNLFRSSSKKPTVTPLPPSRSLPAGDSPYVGAGANDAYPPDEVVAGSRYKYKGAGKTTPGDRAAAQRLAEQGITVLKARRYMDAVAAFRSAVAADASWFQAHFNLAVAAMEAGRTSEALAASETALALDPDSVPARHNFALALKRGGYSVDAAVELEKVLRADPDDARAHVILGNLYAEQLRQTEKARAHYQRALAIDPGHPQAGAIHFWLTANPGR